MRTVIAEVSQELLSAEHFVSSPSQSLLLLQHHSCRTARSVFPISFVKDMCLIIRFYRTMEEVVVMVVIVHLPGLLEVLEDMDHHLLEGMERRPRLDMEEEEE